MGDSTRAGKDVAPSVDELDGRLGAVREKLRRLGVPCRPPLSSDALVAFEERHRIRLPEAYRRFLMTVGDGIWTDGFLPLDRWPGHAREMDLPDDYLARVSCLTPELYSGDAWARFRERTSPQWRAVRPDDEENDLDLVGCGLIAIRYCGCSMYYMLVVSGPHAGRLVYCALEEFGLPPYFPPAPDFVAWIDRYLDEKEAGYDLEYFGWGPPGNERELLSRAAELDPSELVRALRRFPTLSCDAIELLMRIVKGDDLDGRRLAIWTLTNAVLPPEYAAPVRQLIVSKPKLSPMAIDRLMEKINVSTGLLRSFALMDLSSVSVPARYMATLDRIVWSDPDPDCRKHALDIITRSNLFAGDYDYTVRLRSGVSVEQLVAFVINAELHGGEPSATVSAVVESFLERPTDAAFAFDRIWAGVTRAAIAKASVPDQAKDPVAWKSYQIATGNPRILEATRSVWDWAPPDWVCPGCSESVPGTLGGCWNCDAPKPALPERARVWQSSGLTAIP
jgi:hypothetical protein